MMENNMGWGFIAGLIIMGLFGFFLKQVLMRNILIIGFLPQF